MDNILKFGTELCSVFLIQNSNVCFLTMKKMSKLVYKIA